MYNFNLLRIKSSFVWKYHFINSIYALAVIQNLYNSKTLGNTGKLLLFSIMIFIISCGRKGESSIYLIPKDYEGNLIIIFNQREGEDSRYEKQNRIYHFDRSGILKTKFQPNYGLMQDHYYYLDSLGNRTALRYLLPSEQKDTDEVVIFNKETGNDLDTTLKMKRNFELLTVGKQSNADSLANMRSRFMWEVLK